MRHSRLRGVLGATLAALPASAHANMGIGFFAPSILVTVPALIPAILIEAVVLARMLELRFPAAAGTSFLANLASTIVGAVLAIALDLLLMGGGPEPDRVVFMLSLVPMFLFSWCAPGWRPTESRAPIGRCSWPTPSPMP